MLLFGRHSDSERSFVALQHAFVFLRSSSVHTNEGAEQSENSARVHCHDFTVLACSAASARTCDDVAFRSNPPGFVRAIVHVVLQHVLHISSTRLLRTVASV